MRFRLLKLLAALLLATLPSSCILTGKVNDSIRLHEDAKLELVVPGVELEGRYLGMETIDGDAKYVVAVPGLLRDVPGRELLLYLSADRGASLIREVAASPHGDAPRVDIEYLYKYRRLREDSDPSRPLWIRLSRGHADSLGIFSSVAGRRIGGVADLQLSYRRRSLLAAGLRRSLYVVTVPIDVVVFPILFPIVMIALSGQKLM